MVLAVKPAGWPKTDITSYCLFSKMGDKGEGGVKNLKKGVTSFRDSPRVKK